MQQRHIDRKRYFEKQAYTCRKYYIPYIRKAAKYIPNKILEVGCGEGGNLLPFAELECNVVGVDIASSRIEQAEKFFKDKGQEATFIASDIFKLRELKHNFGIIICHDVIEHISNKAQFLSGLKPYLSADGIIFIAFPAWQMPFGGHQQIATNKIVSHLPFVHLLPFYIYRKLLEWCGEQDSTIKELLEIKKTRCTIERFKNIVSESGYKIADEQLYLINPHYEVKFRMTPQKLNRFISHIPYIRNFFSTSCFYILKTK